MSKKSSRSIVAPVVTAPAPVEVPAILTPREFMLEVRPPQDWHELLQLMKNARTIWEKLGLVHFAFDLETREEYWDEILHKRMHFKPEEPLKFFFECADGWKKASLLDWRTPEERFAQNGHWIEERKYFVSRDKNGNRITRRESEQRQELARKIYGLLCRHFFQIDETPRYKMSAEDVQHEWMEGFVSGPLFSVVRTFFSVEIDRTEGSAPYIRNLSHPDESSVDEKHAVNFLLKLAKFLWTWKEDTSWEMESKMVARKAENIRMRCLVDEAKPWMIEILSWLKRLDVLEKRILELDEPCLVKLKEIALRNELSQYRHPVTDNRKVTTLDEACYLGSRAAWLLKWHELMVAEHKRLEEIRSAEWAMEEAARQVERLTKT